MNCMNCWSCCTNKDPSLVGGHHGGVRFSLNLTTKDKLGYHSPHTQVSYCTWVFLRQSWEGIADCSVDRSHFSLLLQLFWKTYSSTSGSTGDCQYQGSFVKWGLIVLTHISFAYKWSWVSFYMFAGHSICSVNCPFISFAQYYSRVVCFSYWFAGGIYIR